MPSAGDPQPVKLYLEVSRHRLRQSLVTVDGIVRTTVYLRLRGTVRRTDRPVRQTLGSLPRVRLISDSAGSGVMPHCEDRGKAWQALADWIKFTIIFKDPAVERGQYENRLKAEDWAHRGTAQSRKADLYDWQRDESVLQRLRPRYRPLRDRLMEAIGRPRQADFDRLYPNEYDDIGFSDAARKRIKELKVVFGSDIFGEGEVVPNAYDT